MPQPDYPPFSKRYQRDNKRGAYNFEKSKEYELAEKWFKSRKESQREPIPVPPPPPKTKGPPPGLEKKVTPPLEPIPTPIRVKHDDCELDLKIPSYDEFHYVNPDDELPISLPIFNLNTNILFEQQYSTPLITEGEIYTDDDYDIDTYEGQLAEFEAQEAIAFANNIQLIYNQIMMYQMMMLMYSATQC